MSIPGVRAVDHICDRRRKRTHGKLHVSIVDDKISRFYYTLHPKFTFPFIWPESGKRATSGKHTNLTNIYIIYKPMLSRVSRTAGQVVFGFCYVSL